MRHGMRIHKVSPKGEILEEVYMRMAEMIGGNESADIGIATVKSISPLRIIYEGTEITEGIYASAELISTADAEGIAGEDAGIEELAEVVGEHLMDTQLSAGDTVAVFRADEVTVVFAKLKEVC